MPDRPFAPISSSWGVPVSTPANAEAVTATRLRGESGYCSRSQSASGITIPAPVPPAVEVTRLMRGGFPSCVSSLTRAAMCWRSALPGPAPARACPSSNSIEKTASPCARSANRPSVGS